MSKAQPTQKERVTTAKKKKEFKQEVYGKLLQLTGVAWFISFSDAIKNKTHEVDFTNIDAPIIIIAKFVTEKENNKTEFLNNLKDVAEKYRQEKRKLKKTGD